MRAFDRVIVDREDVEILVEVECDIPSSILDGFDRVSIVSGYVVSVKDIESGLTVHNHHTYVHGADFELTDSEERAFSEHFAQQVREVYSTSSWRD